MDEVRGRAGGLRRDEQRLGDGTPFTFDSMTGWKDSKFESALEYSKMAAEALPFLKKSFPLTFMRSTSALSAFRINRDR